MYICSTCCILHTAHLHLHLHIAHCSLFLLVPSYCDSVLISHFYSLLHHKIVFHHVTFFYMIQSPASRQTFWWHCPVIGEYSLLSLYCLFLPFFHSISMFIIQLIVLNMLHLGNTSDSNQSSDASSLTPLSNVIANNSSHSCLATSINFGPKGIISVALLPVKSGLIPKSRSAAVWKYFISLDPLY